ncbi:hypothetical protein E2C01_027799 [Portunus trituberculatus]|uniref:Uncharacterized protein n=1 Tax=Portunus trituberculatus TaxID=210409 RepID=A0A5B7EJM0_PORTR|nr:hypothetical protein [Portunus trituberculatus]
MYYFPPIQEIPSNTTSISVNLLQNNVSITLLNIDYSNVSSISLWGTVIRLVNTSIQGIAMEIMNIPIHECSFLLINSKQSLHRNSGFSLLSKLRCSVNS